MRVAKENLYEKDERGEPYRLAIAKGEPVSKANMKYLGVKDSQVAEVDDPAEVFDDED